MGSNGTPYVCGIRGSVLGGLAVLLATPLLSALGMLLITLKLTGVARHFGKLDSSLGVLQQSTGLFPIILLSLLHGRLFRVAAWWFGLKVTAVFDLRDYSCQRHVGFYCWHETNHTIPPRAAPRRRPRAQEISYQHGRMGTIAAAATTYDHDHDHDHEDNNHHHGSHGFLRKTARRQPQHRQPFHKTKKLSHGKSSGETC